MNNSLKIFANATLLFAIIGFISYLFFITASFLGCCTGITEFLYRKITLLIMLIGMIVFVFCLHNNCYRTRKM
jgi:hypothetical protein